MFQVKDFVSIVASMVNYCRGTTTRFSDFNVGSKVRTMLEASAIEIEELYQQILNGLLEAIPTSVYVTFDFQLLPATATSTLVRVAFSPGVAAQTISAGTLLTRSDQAMTYAAETDVPVPAGAPYVDVLVTATVPGAAGNLAAGTTFTISPSPSGTVSAMALAAASNGTDIETQAGRYVRFTAYIRTLARGTVTAVEYALLQAALTDTSGGITEQVKLQLVIEPYKLDPTQPVGLVNCYVHNGTGNTSPALVAQALQIVQGFYTPDGVGVPGYKAAGVHVTVTAATEQPVSPTGIVTLAPNVDPDATSASIMASLETYLLGLKIGAPYEVSQATAIIMGVPGVLNWVPTAPTADVPAAAAFNKIMPGAIDLGLPIIATLDQFVLDQNTLQ